MQSRTCRTPLDVWVRNRSAARVDVVIERADRAEGLQECFVLGRAGCDGPVAGSEIGQGQRRGNGRF